MAKRSHSTAKSGEAAFVRTLADYKDKKLPSKEDFMETFIKYLSEDYGISRDFGFADSRLSSNLQKLGTNYKALKTPEGREKILDDYEKAKIARQEALDKANKKPSPPPSPKAPPPLPPSATTPVSATTLPQPRANTPKTKSKKNKTPPPSPKRSSTPPSVPIVTPPPIPLTRAPSKTKKTATTTSSTLIPREQPYKPGVKSEFKPVTKKNVKDTQEADVSDVKQTFIDTSATKKTENTFKQMDQNLKKKIRMRADIKFHHDRDKILKTLKSMI